MNIKDIDKNLDINTKINEKDLRFISALEDPFDVYGTCGERYLRLPLKDAERVSEGVKQLAANTSGVRIRFKTDSKFVAVSVKYSDVCRIEHMSLAGTSGIDMYTCEDGGYLFQTLFLPPISMEDSFESIHYFDTRQIRDITLNLPLYSSVSDIYIGLDKNALIEHGEKYKNKRPVIYYGSSITQGGCATRPGNSYPAIISRKLNLDFVNLGFSGNAKGEPAMAEYIAKLDMSCFVFDYDFNAPTLDFLKNTHHTFFDIVRKKNPMLPIIIMSMPYNAWVKDIDERKRIIKETCDFAIAGGDENVYFVDGEKTFDVFGGDSGTFDGTHPNDLGFMCMAAELEKYIERLD